LLAQHQVLQSVAGNLANQNTLGFLSQRSEVVGFLPETVEAVGAGKVRQIGQIIPSQAVLSQLDVNPGAIRETGVNTDLAITGSGFFTLRSPQGLAYTQDGRFHADAGGQLVTAAGDVVLSAAGKPIAVGSGAFEVRSDGAVMQNGAVTGTLALSDLSSAGLVSLGGSLYQSKAPLPFTGQVVQGALNTSNGSLTQETADLMQAQEAYQSLTSLVNEESSRLKTAGALGVLA
jgi:flagellar basal body rod protein FlgG